MEIRKYHRPTKGNLTWVGAGDACASKNKRIHSNTFSGSLSGVSKSMQMARPIGGFGKVKSGNMSSWRPTHAHAPRLFLKTFVKTFFSSNFVHILLREDGVMETYACTCLLCVIFCNLESNSNRFMETYACTCHETGL